MTSRQLVICLDGTGNRFGNTPTNVLKLRSSFSAKRVVAYYDQGVGTFGLRETLFEWQKVPARICGLAFGWGLKRTVQGAYEFLAREYSPGDVIYLFGFSRGAYVARALASLIYACGLVESHQLNMFEYAWSMLLAKKKVERIDSFTNKKRVDRVPDWRLQRSFKKTFGRKVQIRFIGLFDTVKSVGWVFNPTVIPYTAKNPAVEILRHAQSIDERRCFFRQNSWSDSPKQSTDVKQVWFAGVHSDVGGGYEPMESALSAVALRWMAAEAIENGLELDRELLLAQMQLPAGAPPDESVEMHNSLDIRWKLAEWMPTYIWESGDGRRRIRIGTMPPFGTPRPRQIPEGALIHSSVSVRAAARDYRPINLPKDFMIVCDAKPRD